MDILSQAVFGASTYAVAKGEATTKGDLLWGMALGMLVDADVFLGLGMNSVDALVNHRSWSHSALFAVLATAGIGWSQGKWGKRGMTSRDWFAIFIAIHTHVWLDALTTYGTQIGFPFSTNLVAWDVMHVFHPIATLVLVLPWLWSAFNQPQNWGRVGLTSLGAFAVFLAWPLTSKSLALKAMNTSELPTACTVRVVPTAFNSWIWQGVVNAGDSMGFATIHVGQDETVIWNWIQSDRAALARLADSKQVQNYLKYTGPDALIERDSVRGETRIYAAKFGPINYEGEPQFVYPLVVKDGSLSGEIRKEDMYTGPWSNFGELWSRLR